MSGSNFYRLYREIDKSLPSGKVYDFTYKIEVDEVLRSSSSNRFQGAGRKVQPLKFHGKLARIKAEKVDVAKKVKKQEENKQKKKEFRDTSALIQHHIETQNVVQQVAEYVEHQQYLPPTLVRRLCEAELSPKKSIEGLLKPLTPLNASKSIQQTPTSNQNEKINLQQQEGIILPSLQKKSSFTMETTNFSQKPFQQSQQQLSSYFHGSDYHFHQKQIVDCSYSEQKWTEEERQRLLLLYQENPIPHKNAHPEVWNIYFTKIAEKFHVFYSQRSLYEVKKKVRSMILKRQMKENGELEYWKQIQQQQRKLVGKR
jgi:hypothetical protein